LTIYNSFDLQFCADPRTSNNIAAGNQPPAASVNRP
jgi:hypothetical protein